MPLLQGDCLAIMPTLPDNSVDSIVTDPPYGLSFMGKKWDYDVPSQEIWEECLRVLKPGGYLLSFAGTRTQHRMAVRIEDAGFEIRDMIAWVYGSGFPKSLNIGKAVDKLQGNEREVTGKSENGIAGGTGEFTSGNANTVGFKAEFEITKGTSEWEGWGTALKPALEPITVARKPLSEKTVAENVLKWGTGGINIDGSRVWTTDTYHYDRKGGNTGEVSWKGLNVEVSADSNPLGRFPANLIHDGSDEVVSLFPNSKSTGGRIGNKGSALNMMGNDYEKGDPGYGDSGSAARFFYCAKASKSERNRGCEGLPLKDASKMSGGEETRPDRPTNHPMRTNHHPTVKPIALMEYLIKLVSREGATVLDPFLGSGTTGIACKNLNREFIGIELDPEYFEIAKRRIDANLR